jgi:mRNA interferase RelE/StbE
VARYRILLKASAVKEIEHIPTRQDRRRVVARIRGPAEEPRTRGCEKLSGENRYRVRQGAYRIVYSVHDTHLVVHVVKVGHRKNVYRR